MKLDFSADRLISMGIILLKAIIILVAGHYLTLFLIKLMKKSLKKLNIDISLEKFLKKAVNITLHIIIILSALSTLGISTSGLLAALSAAAVAVALALKDSLSSIAGGIILLLTRRFQTGDYVCINGESGNVVQIDMMHTVLKTLDNRHVVIPNSIVVNSQVVDYSSEETRRLDLTFSVSYDNENSIVTSKRTWGINTKQTPKKKIEDAEINAVKRKLNEVEKTNEQSDEKKQEEVDINAVLQQLSQYLESDKK